MRVLQSADEEENDSQVMALRRRAGEGGLSGVCAVAHLRSTMRLAYVFALIGIGASAVAGCETDVSTEEDGAVIADLVLTGGRVWVGPEVDANSGRWPTAVAVEGGRIAAVGSDAEILEMASAATRRIDLEGRLVVPGFIDAHTHFIDGGFELSAVQLRDAGTPDEFVARIGARARRSPEDWIMGGQWDHEAWGGRLPERAWIDSVTPGTPVFVQRLDLHMGLANSVALELAGIDVDTPDPPGGTIVRDEAGRPTGVLKDEAMSLLWAAVPEPGPEAMDRALEAAAAHALAHGVTAVTHMGTWDDLQTFRRVAARGELPLRVYAVVQIEDWGRLATFVTHDGRGTERLRWGAVKGFVDGSLGSGTAWFHEPYSDEPDNRGLVVEDTARLGEAIVGADSAGLQLLVHAIGDAANDWLLETFAAAEEANGPRDRRFRIEHAQHLTTPALRRIVDQRVIASVQPYHAIDDGRWAERRIGPRRSLTTYPFRDLLDSGARLAFGSDWTVAPIDPLQGIYAAVTRRTLDGAHPDGWVPRQKIGLAEALTAYTADAAYASFMEDELGRVETGFAADLVVLSADLFAMDPAALADARVDLTLVGGEVVFAR
ncbi:MAG: amidohydrolase [Gemmatimonadota bacterium]